MGIHSEKHRQTFVLSHLLLIAVLGATAVVLMHWTSFSGALGAATGIHAVLAIRVQVADRKSVV